MPENGCWLGMMVCSLIAFAMLGKVYYSLAKLIRQKNGQPFTNYPIAFGMLHFF